MKNDIVDLFEHVWQRFSTRMHGLTTHEWRWHPLDDEHISLEWRLAHIATFLNEQRNAAWLGAEAQPSNISTPPANSADEALSSVSASYNRWMDLLRDAIENDRIDQPIGVVAGSYAHASRYSFVLHIADEFIHHTAEAALLRDFYAKRHSWQPDSP